MARLRVGVALLVPGRAGDEIDGLRRALGDTALARVPPHLTLVPPVNVRLEALGEALATLRAGAAAAPGRLALALGPVATFLPVNPVLYLAVGGDLEPLGELRGRVLSGPLARPLTWPFVPHVTLTDQAQPDRVAAALGALGSYHAVVSVEAVHLLQEVGHGADRRWTPIADVALGAPAVIGRGGLALELTRSERLDPEGGALAMAVAGDGQAMAPGGVDRPATLPSRRPIVITGRREGEVVGIAAVWLTDDGAAVAVVVAAAHRGQGIGGHLLAAVESAAAADGWQSRHLHASGPARFYAARSRWSAVPAHSNTIDE